VNEPPSKTEAHPPGLIFAALVNHRLPPSASLAYCPALRSALQWHASVRYPACGAAPHSYDLRVVKVRAVIARQRDVCLTAHCDLSDQRVWTKH
jgi:hypothetical protein